MGDQDKTDPFKPADNETVRKGESTQKPGGTGGGKKKTEISKSLPDNMGLFV